MRRLSAFAAAFAFALPAAAQTAPANGGIPTPGRSLAGGEDASSTANNPANLGFLPGPELRWMWYRTAQASKVPNRGHAFDLASPLFFGFSGGLRVDLVRPPDATPVGDTRIFTWGLAFAPTQAFSLGFSVGRSTSDDVRTNGLTGVSTSFTARPSAYFAIAGIAKNWNSYTSADGVRLDRAFGAGFSVRPTGTRTLEIALEAEKEQGHDKWTPRAVAGLDIPYLGRLRADFALGTSPTDDTKRAAIASVGIDVNGAGSQLSAGGIFGKGLGGGSGFYAGAAIRGFREPGIPGADHFVKIRIEKTPSNRTHARLLRTLWRLAESDEVIGVALHLKAEPASSTAHAEEMGDAIRKLRAAGKKVFCHVEDGGARTLHVCSQADRIVMNPAGGLRFSGLRLQYMYYGAALAKLGVRVDFVRIGAHKTAAESYTLSGPTPTADDDHRDLLAQFEKTLYHDVGGGRKISEVELRQRIAKGPFVAKEAKEAGLIDSYAYDDELEAVASELVGYRVRLIDSAQSPLFAREAPRVMGERDRIAMVYVDGDMMDGRSRDIPIVGNRIAGSYTIAAAVKAAREDPRVRAVLLRVESPGGSSLAADIIWRELMLTAEKKPLVVSMGSTAASGGYYVAAPGNVIFANRGTLTGSIGIFYGKPDVEDLLKKLGINVVTYRSSPRADAESLYRPFSDDERAELGRKVKLFYETFVDRVARGRKMSPEDVDKVGRGRVWTGEQALKAKLVDRLGGLREALDEAKRLAGLARDVQVVELPEIPTDLLSVALSLAGIAKGGDGEDGAEPSLPLPPALLEAARAIAPLALYGADTPLARLDVVPFEP